jgi:hypothetical protein
MEILTDNIIKSVNDDIYLPTGAIFSLKINNFFVSNSKIILEINGEKQGIWNVGPKATIYIDRPFGVNKHFKVISPNMQLKIRATIIPDTNQFTLGYKWITPKLCQEDNLSPVNESYYNNYPFGKDTVMPNNSLWKNMNSFKMSRPHGMDTAMKIYTKNIIPMNKVKLESKPISDKYKNARQYEDFFLLPSIKQQIVFSKNKYT